MIKALLATEVCRSFLVNFQCVMLSSDLVACMNTKEVSIITVKNYVTFYFISYASFSE